MWLYLTLVSACILAGSSVASPASRCPTSCWCGTRFETHWQAPLRVADCAHRQIDNDELLHGLPDDVQVLLVDGNELEELKLPELPDLLHLNASGNQLRSVPTGAFEGVNNMRLLDLSNNKLSALHAAAFDGMYELRELDLSRNSIERIDADAFQGLSMLENLQLHQNPLQQFDSVWLRGLSHLNTLNLHGCKLSQLAAKSFQSAGHLQHLDLSNNQIRGLDGRSLIGLAGLQYLNLAGNALPAVPQRALGAVGRSLKMVDLSGNMLQRVNTDDFAAMPALAELRLSRMPELQLVDMGAFTRLPKLVMVQLHDNPRLAYIDPAAFVLTPAVRHLYLHNNNLTVVSEELLVDSLPRVEVVSLYGNPLTCDCNLRWLRLRLADQKQAHKFAEWSRLACGPGPHQLRLLTSLDESDLDEQCAPRIVHLLQPAASAPAGSALRFDCRAVGVPPPKIVWVAPDGRPVQPQVYHPKRWLVNGRTLSLHSVSSGDSGVYTCLAESTMGSAVAYSRLSVEDARVRLSVLAAAAQSIAVTWRSATAPTDSQHLFQLVYRRVGSPMHHYAATVTPSMHSFTVTGLEPNTAYEVCLAVENADRVVTHVRCAAARTKDLPQGSAPHNIHYSIANSPMFAHFTSEVLSNLALCIVGFVGCCGLMLSCVTSCGRSGRDAAVAPMSDMVVDDETDDSDTVSRVTWLPDERPPPCTVVKSAAFSRLAWPPLLAGARTPPAEV